LSYFRQAVDLRRKILPPDHPDLMDAEYNYSKALERSGQVTAAEPILRNLFASYTRVLGPRHVDTLMAAQGVAQNLLKQQRYAEAMAIALPAAQGMSAVAGDEHQWTQSAWGVYGVAACLSGHGEEGLAALRRLARAVAVRPDRPPLLQAAPAVCAALERDACALADLARRAGRPLMLRPEPGLAPLGWRVEE